NPDLTDYESAALTVVLQALRRTTTGPRGPVARSRIPPRRRGPGPRCARRSGTAQCSLRGEGALPIRLEVLEDGVARGLFELPAGGSFVAGRHESCELVVTGSGVSRRHALVSIFGDELAVQDLASRNGTYVNGDEVKAERLLAPGDTIRLGKSVLVRVRVS